MSKEEEANEGTIAIDATCAPANIRYPQDISLLNAAREKWNKYPLTHTMKADV